ncbi:MAG TPA: response regulator [Burkholderiales bacterium]|nr:response regulator [Burkholderiales bacterium]
MTDRFSATRPAQVLLVEDVDDDAELVRLAFAAAKQPVELHCVEDGEKCLAFLRRQPPYQDAPVPHLVLLDLNMPRMDGREVMAELARDDALKHLPVVVLTTSSDEADVLELYRLRCSSYVVKPVGFENFVATIRLLGDYWLRLVVLPRRAGAAD